MAMRSADLLLALWLRRVVAGVAILLVGAVVGAASAGNYTVLYSFCVKQNCPDGQDPANPLIMDGSGNLYGTTEFGGAHQAGTVYMIPAGGGSETVLYSFTGGADGYQPISGVIMDGNGNLYGVTKGNTGAGTVYQLTTKGHLNVLATGEFNFQAGLVMDGNDNIYGTATDPDTSNAEVFELPSATRTPTRHRDPVKEGRPDPQQPARRRQQGQPVRASL